MERLLIILILFSIFVGCKEDDGVPCQTNESLLYDIRVDNAHLSVTGLIITPTNTQIKIEFNFSEDMSSYLLNDVSMEFWDPVDFKYKHAPFPSPLNDDLVRGKNIFIFSTEPPGFDFYNQRYYLVNASKKNFSGEWDRLYLIEFSIKRK